MKGWRRVAGIVAAAASAAGALWQLSLLLRLWWARVRYPWDVEWLESSALYQAYRSMKGLSTYGPPRDGYLPLNHPPLYPAVLGAVGRVIGLDYPMARTLSLLSFLVAGALMVRALVRRHEGSRTGWALGAFAVGCGAAGVPVCEGFLDTVREDAMAAFFCTVLAVLVDREADLPPRRIVLVALMVVAVVFTRQPTVFFAIWVVGLAFVRHRRAGLLLAVTGVAACGVALVALQFMSKGWYWLHTVSLVQDQGIQGPRFLEGIKILVRFAPFLAALPLVAGLLAAVKRLSASAALWTGMLVASIPACLLPFAKVGGFSNDFVPAVFFIGPATAFLAGDLLLWIDDGRGTRPRLRLGVEAALLVAGAAFLFLRTWDMKPFVPDEAMFRRARELNAKVASLKGGVVAGRHPFLAVRNGDTTPQWSDMPYLDLVWSGFSDIHLGAYLDKAHPRYALVSGSDLPTVTNELSLRFQLDDRIHDAPWTIVGERSQMRYLLRANDDEKDGHLLFDFESLDGWTVTGDAFSLTTARPPGQYPINGVVGRHIANSYNPSKGKDGARGTMISPHFKIDRPHMSLRVGGGFHPGTRAELRVDGRAVRTAIGIFEQQETLTRVVWDLSALQGREAQLWLIDEDSGFWAHLICDHVVLY